jgi:hypothetical protein
MIMGNNAHKREQALKHNEYRAYKKKCADELAQDKIDNPEKYKATRAQRQAKRKAMMFASMAMTISPNAFDDRLLK